LKVEVENELLQFHNIIRKMSLPKAAKVYVSS